MKEQLEEYYGIHVIGQITLSQKTYKLKCIEGYYVLKCVKDKHVQRTLEYIETLHMTCFVRVLLNKNNEYVTPYQQHYIYLMPYIDNSQGQLKEMKIKFYFETLAYLHYHSFYYTKVNQQYFETLQHDIITIINERFAYYEQMIQNFENIMMRSPSQWMLVMNYYRIYEALCSARQYLSQYLDKTKEYHQIRVCMNYKHFDYNHISLKENCFLSIDNVCIDLPIYDLFDIYQRIPDILFDLDCFSEYYLKKIELKDDEKLLLCCLMNIVPLIDYGQDEIENIIKLSRLLYYLDSITHFIHQL
ncbi:MAG: hypothetical protein KHZ15_04940 [Coprobacillus cateniformis]|uniref:hypothetical protein n=1 Tax=Longibaculum muris TaxID=1796628 RepID=UPI003AB38414|nr:hypothetical protein [Coprobacillus cateniformis]